MVINHPIYHQLYTDEDHMIYLITGGRASGKSFGAGTFIERLTFSIGKDKYKNVSHVVLYTRYTMTSARISVIPEFMEKVEIDGTDKYFHVTSTDVVNMATGGKILFRGIHTSSGNQTAKLKSIHGLTVFVVDEAEEWMSEAEFETILYSIRKKGIRIRVIIIMNPTDSNHWVYKRFIEKTHRIEYFDGVPVQISTHPKVLHIHTSYLDNKENLSEDFLASAEDVRRNDPDKYAHIFMGRWSDVREGAIYKFNVTKTFPAYAQHLALGMDFGYSQDPTAIVLCGMVDRQLFVKQICYKTGMLTRDIIAVLRQFPGLRVIADSADPRLIAEIAAAGINILSVVKGPGSIVAGIEKTKEYEMMITEDSYETQEEARNYVWGKDKNGKYVNDPEPGQADHAMDAIRYYVTGEILGKAVHNINPSNFAH